MAKKAKKKLTHLNRRGEARMVDVSEKAVTARRAVASAELRVSARTLRLIREGALTKGDVAAVARIAGIQAAKRTSELIPLCHPLPIEAVDISLTFKSPGTIRIEAAVVIQARTGVEMEALVAVSVTALAVYDMCKSVDRGIVIGPIRLERKSGGRSGDWRRS